MTKYREKIKDNIEVLKLDKNIKIDNTRINKVCSKVFNKTFIGKKLNKLDNAKLISAQKRVKIYKNAKENGFFMLNGFADCYRKSIKISYVTLYRRLYKNKDILKTLIDNKFIEIYYAKNKIDLKNQTDSKNYLKVKVFYNKRFEFIKFIKTNFLNELQKSEKI